MQRFESLLLNFVIYLRDTKLVTDFGQQCSRQPINPKGWIVIIPRKLGPSPLQQDFENLLHQRC